MCHFTHVSQTSSVTKLYLILYFLLLDVDANLLLDKSLHTLQHIEQASDYILDNYIDEFDEYYYNTDNDASEIFDDASFNAYEDPDLAINFADPSQSNDDLQSYLEAPGYTVKMNEIVFRNYLTVLLDLYAMNEDHKFGDAKAATEELRLALQDEARYFFEQPLRSIGAIIADKWNTYKWDIAKLVAHEIPFPVVGYILKISIALIQYEPAVRQFIKHHIEQRKVRSKYSELDESLHVSLGEPFALYVLKHWKPSDEDLNSIHNMELKCPLKPKRVIVQQGAMLPNIGLLRDSPGKCVYKRKDHKVVESKKKLRFRAVAQCVDKHLDFDGCSNLREIRNIDCHWQYCHCVPYSLFPDVVSCDAQWCIKKKQDECKSSAGCEWI